MNRFLDERSMWPTILKVAKEAQGRRFVASAFLGSDTPDWLPLTKGDTLLVALSLATSRAGQVSPAAVTRFRKRGVQIYRSDNLHAKVYLFGDTAIVGSANVSSTSRTSLDEAGILTREVKTVRQIRSWFAERCGQEIEEDFLKLCEQVWRPPSGGKGKAIKDPALEGRTWILRLNSSAEQLESYELIKKSLISAASKSKAIRGWQKWNFYWQAKGGVADNVQPGDTVISVSDGEVFPYGTVLARRRSKTPSGSPITWFRVTSPTDETSLPWAKFEAAAKLRSVLLSPKPRTTQVKSVKEAAVLRQLASVGEILKGGG